MINEEKLTFCFYCGKLLKDYRDKDNNRCPFCGVELNYTNHKISKK